MCQLIDGEGLIVALIRMDMPDLGDSLEQERDIDTLGALPVLIYHVSGAGQTSNGDGITFVSFDFTAIANTAQDAFDLAKQTYDFARAWDDEVHVTDDGWVAEITDSRFPSKDDSTEVEGKTIHQYSGSLDLTLRNN